MVTILLLWIIEVQHTVTTRNEENEPTKVPNPSNTQTNRKKRPVSRKDSNLYDLVDNEENLYDAISLDENETTCKPNVPTTQHDISKTSEKVSKSSAASQGLEKKKVQKRQTEENEGHSVTINCTKNCAVNCNKRCIFVSILCAIVVLGVGSSVVYLFQEEKFESVNGTTPVTPTPTVNGTTPVTPTPTTVTGKRKNR